VQVRSVD